eukprot:scaffold5233_cov127-Isochrysis_galbana.AAC.5
MPKIQAKRMRGERRSGLGVSVTQASPHQSGTGRRDEEAGNRAATAINNEYVPSVAAGLGRPGGRAVGRRLARARAGFWLAGFFWPFIAAHPSSSGLGLSLDLRVSWPRVAPRRSFSLVLGERERRTPGKRRIGM